MKCPHCNETLVMSDRQGIEIDYCPKCRGVWLDKGELDKIIERSASFESSQGLKQHEGRDRDSNYRDDDEEDDRGPFDRKNKPGRRGGFLGNLFDFD